MYHNVEKALASKPYAYIGYSAQGSSYKIKREGGYWIARIFLNAPDAKVMSFYAHSLKGISQRLEQI